MKGLFRAKTSEIMNHGARVWRARDVTCLVCLSAVSIIWLLSSIASFGRAGPIDTVFFEDGAFNWNHSGSLAFLEEEELAADRELFFKLKGSLSFRAMPFVRRVKEQKYFFVAAPLWPIVAVVGGITLWSLRNRPYRKGRCSQCGYDLRGATGIRCPECGAEK